MAACGMSPEWALLFVDPDAESRLEAEKGLASFAGDLDLLVGRAERMAAVESFLVDRAGAPSIVFCKVDATNAMDIFPLMNYIRNFTTNAFVVVYSQAVDPAMMMLLLEHGVSNVVPVVQDSRQTGLQLCAAMFQVHSRYAASVDAAAAAAAEMCKPSRFSHSTVSLEPEMGVAAEERPSRRSMKDLLSTFTKKFGFNRSQSQQSQSHEEPELVGNDLRVDSASELYLGDAESAVLHAREDSAHLLSSSSSKGSGITPDRHQLPTLRPAMSW